MAEHRVVILGEARVDEIRDPGGVRERVSGDAVEIATALLGQGLVLTVVAPVAEDADGERIRSTLQDRGIRLVAVSAAAGTVRRSVVRDHRGAEVELRRGEGAFADTRRSLAAQAEADVIVDLREREITTVTDVRDEVLGALGLGTPASAPQGLAAQRTEPQGIGPGTSGPGESEPQPRAAQEPALPSTAVRAGVAVEESSGTDPQGAVSVPRLVPGGPAARSAGAGVRSSVLLPAPVVAGTYRHGSVRLVPDAPAAHASAPDWHGLNARLSRIAT